MGAKLGVGGPHRQLFLEVQGKGTKMCRGTQRMIETLQRLKPQALGRIRLSRDGKGALEGIQSLSQEQEEDHASQQEREWGQRVGNSGGKQPVC